MMTFRVGKMRNLLQGGILITGLAGHVLSANRSSVDIRSNAGIEAIVDSRSGQYEISEERTGWKFSGKIDAPPSKVSVSIGTDRLGGYREIRIAWQRQTRLVGEIKVYNSTSTVIFALTSINSSSYVHPLFPRFTVFPKALHHFSFKQEVFAPFTFGLEDVSTPWLLFDDKLDAVIISPADNFLISSMFGDGNSEIGCGFNKQMDVVPAMFTRSAIMVFGHGINATWNKWGSALTNTAGTARPANDADIGLRCLGYWTDNGAKYYYDCDTTLGYEGTLTKLAHQYRNEGIPIRYLQLDSWWYDKSFIGPDGSVGTIKNPKLPAGTWNRYGGLMEYKADSMLFPDGLSSFEKNVGVPLVTHDRWLDPSSPYHYKYKTSGFAVVDRKWWNMVMRYLSSEGVVCYEQDWLSEIYKHSPQFWSTTNTGNDFLGYMAQAAGTEGLSLQFCMAYPCFFMQGSTYKNLTTIRVSGDRFARDKWNDFLYASRLASALRIWPWSDVFMSSETDNLLLATLSAGMVGIGDSLGTECKSNLLKAVRSDGVIVKPDAPIVPDDEIYLSDAKGDEEPMVAWTYTDHGPLKTVYVFAYSQLRTETHAAFLPASFGLHGKVVVYDYRSGIAKVQQANEPVYFAMGNDSTAYYVIAPVGRSGIAFFGDKAKFICDGKKRIASLNDHKTGLTVKVTFADNDRSVRLFGYARTKPSVETLQGTTASLAFDPATGRFEVTVSPDPVVKRESPGGDLIRDAILVFRTHRSFSGPK